jgi:hypothetical protein
VDGVVLYVLVLAYDSEAYYTSNLNLEWLLALAS